MILVGVVNFNAVVVVVVVVVNSEVATPPLKFTTLRVA
jgi:hypothetical protein